MSKYFLTGGAGFIGSHVTDHLLENGHQVTVYDNLVSGQKKWIEGHIGENGFQFIEADLMDYETLKKSMAGHDIVWHLGANTDIIKGNNNVDLDLKNCTIATHNTLEAMRHNGINKIMFASSATVYGDMARPEPLAETFGPLLPISLYGAGKLACEALISAYCHLFNINGWIYRFANVVGGRMGHGVIFDFIAKLKNNPAELEILGDGAQTKPFFLVEDCIAGMLHAVEKSEEKPYGVYNLGCNTTTTVTRVAEIVVEEMKLENVKFNYTGGKRGWPGDVPIVRFDASKMGKLGWETSRSSDEAVREAARRIIAMFE